MKRILFISNCEPKMEGSLSRLLYDVLVSYHGDSVIDYTCINCDHLNVQLPDNIHFIPWKNIEKVPMKKKNRNFSFPKVKLMWNSFKDLHINAEDYRTIITFPYEVSALDFVSFNGDLYTFACDSPTMVFARSFLRHKDLYGFLSFIRLLQVYGLDRIVSERSKEVYVVGDSDAHAYEVFYNRSATFVPHTVKEELIRFSQKEFSGDKLTICFAGSLEKFYVGNLLKGIVEQLVNNKECKDWLEISFLGQNCKGEIKQLKKAGYTVVEDGYADDFEEYLSQHDIILVPLITGGGTKNRVLSAIGAGIDVIGTDVALENIFGVKEEHRANTPEEFIQQIRKRWNDRTLYSYSVSDRKDFFQYHSGKRWSELFWDVVAK